MKILFGKFQFITRWIVMTGVLTGLFFSSGEGLQLLPFPPSPDKSSVHFENGKSKPYSLSVHNFGAQQTFIKNKVQKNQKKIFDFDGICGSKLKPSKFSFSANVKIRRESDFYIAHRLNAAPSDRAPPVL
jgi:hypothetical protein